VECRIQGLSIICDRVLRGNESGFSGIIIALRNITKTTALTDFTAETKTMKRHAKSGIATASLLLAGAMVTGTASAQAPAGDAASGAKLNSMCIGCHGIVGYKTAFPEVYSVPKIGGQHPAYIVKALQAYKSGDRNHPSMKGIAATLSDKDMADLAAYYGAGPSKVAGH